MVPIVRPDSEKPVNMDAGISFSFFAPTSSSPSNSISWLCEHPAKRAVISESWQEMFMAACKERIGVASTFEDFHR